MGKSTNCVLILLIHHWIFVNLTDRVKLLFDFAQNTPNIFFRQSSGVFKHFFNPINLVDFLLYPKKKKKEIWVSIYNR